MFASNTSHSAEQLDAQFNYVTMLLPGNGTNGAQNNTFLDASTNNFTITRNGNATQGTFSPYGSNWSNYFSYNATAANYLTSNSLSLSGDFTIEGYVYWDGVGSVPNMFTLGDSFTSTGIEVYLGGGTNWVVYSNNATRITGAAGVKCQWTYIAVTRSGSTVTMYINGVSQGTWTSSATFSGTIRVGAEFYNGTYYSSMSGYISNFRVNNTTAINQVPTAPLTAVSGTIFLTCQSNRFRDASSNNFAITVNGNPSVQRFSPFAPTAAYSAATIGGSGYFDGTGDYLTYSTPAASVREWWANDFTVEAWIYPTNLSTWASSSGGVRPSLVGNMNHNDGTNYWSFGPNTDGNVYLYYYNGSAQTINSSLAVKANQWNHIAFTKTSGGVTFFVNGVGSSTTAISGTPQSSNTVPLTVGGGNSVYITGNVSGLRIINGTAQYSGATYTVPSAPPTAITNTSLLLNFTNAGIIDNAMMNDLETVGNAQISTSVKKYGTGSLAFDGSGDYLTSNVATSNLYAFGAGDFTVELWLYLVAAPGAGSYVNLIDFRPVSTNGAYPTIYLSGSSATLTYFTNDADRITGSNISTATWYHIALCRSGTSTKLFIDGTQTGSTYTDSNSYICGTGRPTIGVNGYLLSTGQLNGYIDDLRITKGYARYTANFSVPTSAFPNN